MRSTQKGLGNFHWLQFSGWECEITQCKPNLYREFLFIWILRRPWERSWYYATKTRKTCYFLCSFTFVSKLRNLTIYWFYAADRKCTKFSCPLIPRLWKNKRAMKNVIVSSSMYLCYLFCFSFFSIFCRFLFTCTTLTYAVDVPLGIIHLIRAQNFPK